MQQQLTLELLIELAKSIDNLHKGKQMSLQRRSFLSGILAAGVSPALCKAGFLMPVKKLVLPLEEIRLQCTWTFDEIGLGLMNPRSIHEIMLDEDRRWLASEEL